MPDQTPMYVDVDGARLKVQDCGTGEPVVLLHGWPDTADLWRHQIRALLAAGYRSIAPDLRGFGESSHPAAVEAYVAPRMVADVIGVLDHLAIERAHIVGHDWGAAIGWMTAALAPDRVATLAALSVGHPAAFRDAGWAQREKSWYMLLFQFPGIAEQWLSADDFRNLRGWTAHPDAGEVSRAWPVPVPSPRASTSIGRSCRLSHSSRSPRCCRRWPRRPWVSGAPATWR